MSSFTLGPARATAPLFHCRCRGRAPLRPAEGTGSGLDLARAATGPVGPGRSARRRRRRGPRGRRRRRALRGPATARPRGPLQPGTRGALRRGCPGPGRRRTADGPLPAFLELLYHHKCLGRRSGRGRDAPTRGCLGRSSDDPAGGRCAARRRARGPGSPRGGGGGGGRGRRRGTGPRTCQATGVTRTATRTWTRSTCTARRAGGAGLVRQAQTDRRSRHSTLSRSTLVRGPRPQAGVIVCGG
jgi:hypothetical protein